MKVRELLSDESKWTKGNWARTGDGLGVYYECPEAVCWCLDGAIHLAYGDDWLPVRGKVCEHLGVTHLWDWNDSSRRTFAEVKALVEELDI